MSTLLQGGFSVESLGKENIDSITSYLESHLQAQSGLLGFGKTWISLVSLHADGVVHIAPSLLADADDTAKAIFTLSLLGRPASLDEMIANFGAKNGHFQTYVGERDCSFSANCNVLIALLHASDPHQYESRISSITTFLCDSWWNGIIKDKWVSGNHSIIAD